MKYFLRAKNIAKSELELTFLTSIFDTYQKETSFWESYKEENG